MQGEKGPGVALSGKLPQVTASNFLLYISPLYAHYVLRNHFQILSLWTVSDSKSQFMG